MKPMSLLMLLVSLMGRASSASSVGYAKSNGTPIQKVIELMEGMLEKGKAEKHDEQVQFAAYKQFCDSTTGMKKSAIKKENERIASLKADIQLYTEIAAKLTKEVAGHDEDISIWKSDMKAATSVRETEKSNYAETHKDYSESIDALKRAIAVLQKQAVDRPQALLELSTIRGLVLMPAHTKQMIDAFLAEDASPMDVSAPEANGYEFQSNGVIEMLAKLLDKFTAERTSLEKTETKTKHAYEMLIQDLTDQMETATQDRGLKTEMKTKKLEAKATAAGDLTDAIATRDADKTYLHDLTAECHQKTVDFQARQKLREEEIDAIEKAVGIISSNVVKGNSDKYLPKLLQVKRPSLAQVSSIMENETRMRLGRYLRSQAKQLSSRLLVVLAEHAEADPFLKVKKMIKDLIYRLMEEANGEAEHKGWCDKELATNEQTRNAKGKAVETLAAEIDALEASIAKLSEEVAELSDDVAELDSAMSKATELRETEKQTNTETVSDAQEAQTAVAQALSVLNEFYAKAGEATAFIQRKEPESPEIFNAPYKGMNGENGGVVGMLQVIQSDFARLESETNAAEVAAQKDYGTFMTDSKVDKTSKSKDIEHKSSKKQGESRALVVAQKDLEGTQKELDMALAYFDKLKPSCVDSGVSYEDRVARRKEEIESLQGALKILKGEDIP